MCGCLPEDAEGNGVTMSERVVSTGQLLELDRRLREVREEGDDLRITHDMVHRLIDFCPFGRADDNGWGVFNQATVALLEKIRWCGGNDGLTRERLQAFLNDPLGTLSNSVVVNHTPLVSNLAYGMAADIRRKARGIGLKDELPSWFDDALAGGTDLVCGHGETVVHRLCLGHVTVKQGRDKILVIKKLLPAGIDTLLSFAATNTYKYPHIATGTVISHKGEFMVSPAEYVPTVWYSPDGVGHLALYELDGETTSDSSYLAI